MQQTADAVHSAVAFAWTTGSMTRIQAFLAMWLGLLLIVSYGYIYNWKTPSKLQSKSQLTLAKRQASVSKGREDVDDDDSENDPFEDLPLEPSQEFLDFIKSHPSELGASYSAADAIRT